MSQRASGSSQLRALVLVAFAVVTLRRTWTVLVSKGFTLDEFQWAHAGWLLARGQVQYRDFFEVHFPLNYQYMSLAFVFGGDDPTTISTMRMMVFPVLLLMAAGMWAVNSRRGWAWALLGPIIVFSIPSFVARAIEIRHDSMGFSLVIASLGCLYLRRPGVRVRAVLAGVLLALACWATQKVFIYGVVFFAATVADLLAYRRKEQEFLLGSPFHFLLGATAVMLAIAAQLTVQGNWGPFYDWCVVYARAFQTQQKGFSWVNKLLPMLRYMWWQLPLAAIGLATTVRHLRGTSRRTHPDQLLLLAWLGSWAAWALLAVPMSYSAIPFLGMTCIFAARGAIDLVEYVGTLGEEGSLSRPAVMIGLTMLFTLVFVRTGSLLEADVYPSDRYDYRKLRKRYFDTEPQNLLGLPDAAEGLSFDDPADDPAPNELAEPSAARLAARPEWAQFDERQNEYQLRVLRKVGELTASTDAVYDNSGSFVARPHAYWFYYTYGLMLAHNAEMLAREVPLALEQSEAVMVLIDTRYKKLPKSVKRYVSEHYQPYNGDILLAGMTFASPERDGFAETFTAVTEGEYFVHPADAIDSAGGSTLTIDGRPVTERVVSLSQGEHEIVYGGGAEEISILWLPRNRELWHPNRGSKARFCCRNSTR